MNARHLVGLLYEKGAALAVEGGDLLIDAPENVLDEELLANIRAGKADIIALLHSLEAAHRAAPETLPRRAARPAAYSCAASPAQRRMLFMEELSGRTSYYNMPVAYRIIGPLDGDALRLAFEGLLAKHDVLRSCYVQEGDGHMLRVTEPCAFDLRESAPADLTEASLHALLQEEANHVFDLARELPIRALLIALRPDEHVLAINIHHIAGDGWSARAIVADLSAGYRRALTGEVATAAASSASYQYADYIAWQEAWLASPARDQARAYWSEHLSGMPELHSLPTDFVRPGVQSVAGRTHIHRLDAGLATLAGGLARRLRTTSFVLLQAIFAALLSRYSGEEDIVFGTAAANRAPAEFADTVGLFVNTLVLRHQAGDTQTFAESIAHAAAVSDDAFRHQQYPFDALVDELRPARSLGYSPLVQLMLVMQEGAAAALALPGTRTEQLPHKQNVAKFDLALHVYSDAGGWRLEWEYSSGLFRAESIAAMAAHFEKLLSACIDDPESRPADVPLVEDSAPRDCGFATLPQPGCVHALFEAQAARRPEARALIEGDTSLSYRDLDAWAEQLAVRLTQAGARPGTRVAVCMEKSSGLVAGMLAVFKVGAVYVPLDPHYPPERLAFMLADSGAPVMLVQDAAAAAKIDARVMRVAVGSADAAGEAPARAASGVEPGMGAYIIYTSGSTGNPKGVLVSHDALSQSLHANRARMRLTEDDSMPTIGSQAFGVSLLEILLPLTTGGAVRLIDKSIVMDMDRLIAQTDRVSVLHAVPSLMRQWLETLMVRNHAGAAHYPDLRLLLVGGEPVPDTLLRKIRAWRPEVRLLELYGMTESAVVCCSYEPGADTAAYYCIGSPHPNAYFRVLNRCGQRQPVGVPGELHIGGPSLALEYINQPTLTAERFIDDPFHPGQRLYKTGDRVKELRDGNYEFLGRVDHQVSLRGARIELAEIEVQAMAVPGVRQAVAHVVELGGGEQTLVLRYVADAAGANGAALAKAIRQALARRLPDYMRPAIVQAIEVFPLNPNGKVDRKRLPPPDAKGAAIKVAPRDEMEAALCAIWADVLQADVVGIHDNFFELGGHSLMAVKLIERQRQSGYRTDIRALFDTPTVAGIAAILRFSHEQGADGASESGMPTEEYLIREALAALTRGAGPDAPYDELRI